MGVAKSRESSTGSSSAGRVHGPTLILAAHWGSGGGQLVCRPVRFVGKPFRPSTAAEIQASNLFLHQRDSGLTPWPKCAAFDRG